MKKHDVRNTPERVSCLGACIILVLCILIGCSSSDSSQRYATFVDSPVEGIAFKTETMSGQTGVYGRFPFVPGETVTFSIGGIIIGATKVKPVITPVDLVTGARDEKDPTVTNITRFLITLDEDNNPDNGITISPEVRTALAGYSVNFAQDTTQFAQDAEALDVIETLNVLYKGDTGERDLCSVMDAQEHLGKTIEELAKSGYNKSGGSSGNIDFGGGDGSGGGGCGG